MRARSIRPSPSKSASTCVRSISAGGCLPTPPPNTGRRADHDTAPAPDRDKTPPSRKPCYREPREVSRQRWCRTLHEREIAGAIRPSGCSLIPHKGWLGAQQDQVKIVIVVVVEPYRLIEAPRRKASPAAGQTCPPYCGRAPDPRRSECTRSIKPSSSKSPGATSRMPVRLSRPVPAASCCPRRNTADSARRPHQQIGLPGAI